MVRGTLRSPPPGFGPRLAQLNRAMEAASAGNSLLRPLGLGDALDGIARYATGLAADRPFLADAIVQLAHVAVAAFVARARESGARQHPAYVDDAAFEEAGEGLSPPLRTLWDWLVGAAHLERAGWHSHLGPVYAFLDTFQRGLHAIQEGRFGHVPPDEL